MELRAAADLARADLVDQHRTRSDAKAALGIAVLQLFEDKQKEIATDNFMDILSEDEQETPTELSRDQAMRDAQLAQGQVALWKRSKKSRPR